MHVIEVLRAGHRIGYMGNPTGLGPPIIVTDAERCRKFGTAADAACYIESFPWPPRDPFGLAVAPSPIPDPPRPRCA